MVETVEYRNLMGGELCAAKSADTLDSINPATGKVWARIPASDRTDVDAAVAAALIAGGVGTRQLIREPACRMPSS